MDWDKLSLRPLLPSEESFFGRKRRRFLIKNSGSYAIFKNELTIDLDDLETQGP